jgi:predicted phosphodiesterase
MRNEPTGVVVAGDWHANGRWALKATYQARLLYGNHIDTIVHTGDFGFNFHDTFLDDLQDRLEMSGMFLYFVDGNHENFNRLYSFPIDEFGTRMLRDRIRHLPRGFRWTWNGKTHLALGGGVSVDQHHRTENSTWWRQETITWPDCDKAVEGGKVDYMFTHDCPDGVDIPGITKTSDFFPQVYINQSNSHRELLRRVVDEVKPTVLYHGHYHRRYGNVLADKDYLTKVIGLDCDGSTFPDNLIPMRGYINVEA